MGIFIKAVVECDGLADKQCASGDDGRSRGEAILSVHAFDEGQRPILRVVDAPRGWVIHVDIGTAKCGQCAKDQANAIRKERTKKRQ